MAAESAIRILLIDDHVVVRAGYRRLLESSPDIQIAAESGGGEEGYALYSRGAFDVVVTDLSLPGISGLETIRRIRQRDPLARILVFSVHEEPGFVTRSLAAGALGYVSKSADAEVLLAAIRSVAGGERFVAPGLAAGLTRSGSDSARSRLQALTPREFDILRLLAEGRSTGEIAEIFSLSQKTVANYHTQIKNKLDVSNLAELTRFAVRVGVISA